MSVLVLILLFFLILAVAGGVTVHGLFWLLAVVLIIGLAFAVASNRAV